MGGVYRIHFFGFLYIFIFTRPPSVARVVSDGPDPAAHCGGTRPHEYRRDLGRQVPRQYRRQDEGRQHPHTHRVAVRAPRDGHGFPQEGCASPHAQQGSHNGDCFPCLVQFTVIKFTATMHGIQNYVAHADVIFYHLAVTCNLSCLSPCHKNVTHEKSHHVFAENIVKNTRGENQTIAVRQACQIGYIDWFTLMSLAK